MPKHDALAAKAISNRQKTVGLQKLKWYCQMCQKQCRDDNGFKCHTMSEGHLRQMKLFSDNSGSILDEFSSDFEKGYLQTLSHLHSTKRVLANRVYQEYIADKHHIHMNATIWTSLSGFCKYLGKEGKAVVEETEKGWYIQYIDRDPKVLARQRDLEERKRSELDDDERSRRLIESQIKISESTCNFDPEVVVDAALEQSVGLVFNSSNVGKRKVSALFDNTEDDDADNGGNMQVGKAAYHSKMKYARTFESLESTGNLAATSLWLRKGIIVKIVCRGSRYENLKGEVESVSLDPLGANIIFEGERKFFTQENLQTVVPKVGEYGLILKGDHSGCKVKVLEIHRHDYNCTVEAENLESKGRWVVEYEDFSKLSEI